MNESKRFVNLFDLDLQVKPEDVDIYNMPV